MENENKVEETTELKPVAPKKGKKKIGLMIGLILAVAVVGWCVYNIVVAGQNRQPADEIYSLSMLLTSIFVIVALGYLLGRITIKGVSLGTAGVFLVAILAGFLFTLVPKNVSIFGALNPNYVNPKTGKAASVIPYFKSVIQNVGLVLFVGSVGFVAGPKFFRDLKKNFKTYIVMGISIIVIGTIVTVIFTLISGIGADFWSGVLSGALTSTPGYSAAQDAMAGLGKADTLVTVGHAIAYPFGVVGVVLFVQLLPKFMKSDMAYERSLLKSDVLEEAHKPTKRLLKIDDFGFAALAIAIIAGLLVGGIKIPLTGDGYKDGALTFSLGTTGGVLIMCLVFGHFGRIGKLSMEVPMHSLKTLKELGLMLFLIGAGVDGGVHLVDAVQKNPSVIVWGLLGGAVITIAPMVAGFFLGKKALKLPLLNNLGSITGGMTSTPALGTLISTAETDDVAGSYASTYPIALVLIVVACNLMISLMM